MKLATPIILTLLFYCISSAVAADDAKSSARVRFDRDDDQGEMRILVDGKEAVVYCYGDSRDLVHFYPVRSPGGKPLTVQHPKVYPHHRSFWFGDKVRLGEGRDVAFYSALYSSDDRKDPKPPFRDHVRHVEFVPGKTSGDEAEMSMKLIWEMDHKTPVLDEARDVRVAALGDGEYLLDVTFTVTASYGDVTFTSDSVHYAWPYIRIDPTFSVEGGGELVNSEGGVAQEGTHNKEAGWVDYSNTVDGEKAGLAMFVHNAKDPSPKWLTRDYGTFGPRRPDDQSGKRFTLQKGDSLAQRIGVLVHRGNAKTGQVAERYEKYVTGGR